MAINAAPLDGPAVAAPAEAVVRRTLCILLLGQRRPPPRRAGAPLSWVGRAVSAAPKFVSDPLAKVFRFPPLVRAAWGLLAQSCPPERAAELLDRPFEAVVLDGARIDEELGADGPLARRQLQALVGQGVRPAAVHPLPRPVLWGAMVMALALLTVASPLVTGPVTVSNPGVPSSAATTITSLAYGPKQVGLLELSPTAGELLLKSGAGWTTHTIRSPFQMAQWLGVPWNVSWFGVEGLALVPAPFVDNAVPPGFPAGRFVMTAHYLWTASASLQLVTATPRRGRPTTYALPEGLAALSLSGAPGGGVDLAWWSGGRLVHLALTRTAGHFHAKRAVVSFRSVPSLMTTDDAGTVLMVVQDTLWAWTPGRRPLRLTRLAMANPLYLEAYGQAFWVVGSTHAELLTDAGQRQVFLPINSPDACAVEANGDLWVYAQSGVEVLTPR